MTTSAPYEALKDDLGYLTLGRAAERFGLLPVPPGGAAEIFHVINTRYERGHPTLVTTNRGLTEWGQVFGDPVVAGAILDRLMHRAIVFNIKGPSWRMREHHALETATRS